MARTSYTTIGGGLIGADRLVQRRYLWMGRGSVARQRQLYKRDELKALPGRSLLPQIGVAWGALSQDIKDAWDYAANVIGRHAYNLFVQDKSYRIVNELAGNADPSYYHQYLVGHLNIPVGAGDVLLRQINDMVFDFPATMRVRFKTALLADNGNGEFVKVRFKYDYNEGAGDLTQTDEIVLPLSSGWDERIMRLTQHTGLLGPWVFEIETNNLKGDIYFDDVWVDFPSGIVTNDPYCLNVLRNWSKIAFPSGVTLETIYPTGGAL